MKHLSFVFCCTLVLAAPAAFGSQDIPAPAPLFAVPAAPPVMMINMSNDHQLYFKAYDDYSDLTGDGQPDTTYNHDFDYFGYFDSYKCYEYRNSRFEPVAVTSNKYCSGNQWSGNFLNWGTMTRMDIVRQILYGGLRSTDTATETVLERAFIPPDAHSFAKYYNGADIAQLTPFKDIETNNTDDLRKNGISFCNTTDISGWSHESLEPPLMRVARGNFSLWASNNVRQCQWSASGNQGENNNDPDKSGIHAYRYPPQDDRNNRSGSFDARLGEYSVRVKVCSSSNPVLNEGDSCTAYPYSGSVALKPTGLLQDYGESGAIHFGLLTGSYARSRSGGVLRRNVGSIADEINSWGGFTNQNESIITTLNRFRIFGYEKWSYRSSAGDNCSFETDRDGRCTNHGNPQAEILLESLRYLAGKGSPISQFDADDSRYIVARDGLNDLPALERVDWNPPNERSLACSPLNVLQFNTSVISHDGNDLHRGNDLFSKSTIESSTDFIGQQEGLQNRYVFAGHVGNNNDGLCTAKRLSSLSSLQGLCPQAPTQAGTYNLAGLARLAREGIIDHQGEKRSVRLFGVDMQPSLPAITIPYAEGQEVAILPVFRNMTINRNGTRFRSGTLNNFRIVEQNHSGPVKTGTFFVAWDDSEHGNDHDVDLYGNISYTLNTNEGTLIVESQGFQTTAHHSLRVGFSVSGTTEDGVFWLEEKKRHDGQNYPMLPIEYGLNPRPLELGVSSGVLPKTPLYYAAKWGGYSRLGAGGQPVGYENSYFAVTNPSELQSSLAQVFEQAATGRGTAVNLASDGIGTYSDRLIYQTRFFSENWTGELLAYRLKAGGELDNNPVWRASQRLPSPTQRNVFTRYDADGQPFDKTLPSSYLGVEDEAARDQLIDYLLGDSSGEDDINLRQRDHQNLPGHNALGHFVNSRPLFVSSRADFGHGSAQGQDERSSYSGHLSTVSGGPSVVYVGSNAGKLHAFDAQSGKELFAYVPESLLPHLKELKKPEFNENHRYFVDGQIRVMDAYDGSSWKRLLVGSLGAGGQVLFGLDVSNPDSFDANDVLWEKSAADIEGLGYQLGDLSISRLPGGEWRVVLGNGYASDQGDARLLFLDPWTGELKETLILETTSDEPNGLSPPFVADLTRDGVADTVYAGDLHGNIWKIELASSITSSSVSRLHAVPNNEVRERPITVKPLVTRHPYGGYAVHVATGRYFSPEDTSINIPTQRYMTLRDTQQSLNEGLFPQELTEHTVNGQRVRSLTNYQPSRQAKGCYFELPEQGERVVAPLMMSGDLFMSTMTPEEGACSVGAHSFLFNFDPYTCGRSGHSAYSDLKVTNPDDPSRPGAPEDLPAEVPVSAVFTPGLATGALGQGNKSLVAEIPSPSSPSDSSSDSNDIIDGNTPLDSLINEPRYRQWWRCFSEQEGDC